MAADGSGLRTLTPSLHRSQTNPDWSPDGGRVTFAMTDAGGKDDLWVVDVDGSNARRVYDCAGACNYVDDPAWSPDGQTIAVCQLSAEGKNYHVGTGTLIAVDVRTGDAKPLLALNPLDLCAGPRWSPDGTRIVLELVHRDSISLATSEMVGVTLAVLDVTTSERRPRALTDPKLFAATADWSPDGKTIVYAALPEPTATNTDIYAIDPEGGDPKRLTTLADEGSAAEEPSFDADGRSVVFVSSATSGLARVETGGGDVAPAFSKGASGHHPRARPLPG